MLYIVFYFSFLVAIIVLFLYGLYSYYKSCKEEEKEWKEFIDSLTPGSKWILRKELSLNPFNEPSSSDTIVIIIDTRENFYGDIWVQYRFEGGKNTQARQVSYFKELYTKLD